MSATDRQALLAKSENLLGWPALLDSLARHAFSQKAQEACRSTPLALSVPQAEESLAQTAEMVGLTEQGKSLPLAAFEDVSGHVERARAQGILSVESLEQIAKILEVSGKVRSFFRDRKKSDPGVQFPFLAGEASRIEPLQSLRGSLDGCLDYKGGLKDSASPGLRKLRTRHRRLRDRVHKRLESMLNEDDIVSHLQDRFYTQRSQRYVIPVKAESRPRFEGIVHDSSSSGATVFLEPAELIEPNNQLKLLESEIATEEQRILKELSEEVAENAGAVLMNQDILTRLDVLHAKAGLALEMKASRPVLNEGVRFFVRSARHPLLLLRRENVVPNDLELGQDKKVLIISGPNAGGKTVCLKMIGLLSLMVRAGLFIPASPDSSLPVFTEVFADIGDEQDISRDISTYSGHLLNIIGILKHAGGTRRGAGSALVLLDEIASSTDPGEGAALATSILRELRERVALTVATTHLGSLKILAENEPGFENAGLEFDAKTLSPTYRLRVGVPGLSLGIQTAAILGLPEHLIGQAREMLDTDTVQVDELVRRLELERKNLEEDRAGVQAETARLKELTKEYRERLDRLKEREKEFKQEAKARLREAIDRGKGEVSAIVQNLKMNRSLSKAQSAREKLEIMKEKLEEDYPEEAPEGEIPQPGQLKKGTRVYVVPFGKTAVLLEDAPDQSGDKLTVHVSMGGIKLSVDAGDLRLTQSESEEAEPAKKEPRIRYSSIDIEPSPTPPSPSNTLDLRGMRAHEAEAAVESYLDDACRSGVPNVFIIHGHGTGVLKQVVREYLAASSYVRSFRPGEKEEGGDGVTMAVLNQIG